MKFSIKSTDILTENLCFTDYVIVTEEISNLELEIERLHSIIKEVRELLSKYNDNESNYCVPVDIALEILDKENNNV